jgi:hypothetical protein
MVSIAGLDDMIVEKQTAIGPLPTQINSYVFSLACYIGDSILTILFSGICSLVLAVIIVMFIF